MLALASMLIGLLGTLAVLEIVFRLLPTTDVLHTVALDAAQPVPRFAPDRDVVVSRGAAFELVVRRRVNNAGYVNDQDYVADARSPLLAVVGDSYVEATQVTHAESAAGRLAARTSGRGRVYSFGVSGAQLPTYAVLAAHARSAWRAHGIVFVIVGNDFDESLLHYKSAPAFYYYRRGADGALLSTRIDYAPSAVTRVARRSALLRYLVVQVGIDPATLLARLVASARAADAPRPFVGNTAAAADARRVADSRDAIDHFLASLPATLGLEPRAVLFVVDGSRPELYDAGVLSAVEDSYFVLMRRYFIERARAAGFEVIDLEPIFVADHARRGARFEFPFDNHWNADGHRVVADAIAGSALYRRLFGQP